MSILTTSLAPKQQNFFVPGLLLPTTIYLMVSLIMNLLTAQGSFTAPLGASSTLHYSIEASSGEKGCQGTLEYVLKKHTEETLIRSLFHFNSSVPCEDEVSLFEIILQAGILLGKGIFSVFISKIILHANQKRMEADYNFWNTHQGL